MSGLIKRLDACSDSFAEDFAALTARHEERDTGLAATVTEIIEAVRTRGDEALLEFTQTFDRHPAATMDELVLDTAALQQALAGLDATTRAALESAATRIRDYHQHQLAESWSFEDAHGNRLGQRVPPQAFRSSRRRATIGLSRNGSAKVIRGTTWSMLLRPSSKSWRS